MKKIYGIILIAYISLFFIAAKSVPKYEVSTYFNPALSGSVAEYKDAMKNFKDEKGLEFIHKEKLSELPAMIREYFNKRAGLKILDFASGDIFGNRKKDYAFIVFDADNTIARIIVYDSKANEYSILFRTMNVIRMLDDEVCQYSIFGTLDYIVGSEIRQNIKLFTEDYKGYGGHLCKCIDITKDGAGGHDFVLDKGCYANGFSRKNVGGFDAICVSTDQTYNDWECLKYDKTLGAFIIFYGQAFAD
jgi:hypothetical protein